MSKKTAILILAFGGADTVENVEPFLKNILSPRTPSPELVEDAKARYRMIGGSSPLTDITTKQAKLIAMRVNRGRKEKLPVYVGMKNWAPYIKDAVADMKKDGIERAITVIMSPFSTPASTGGYVKDLNEAIAASGGGIEVALVEPWHAKIKFVDALIDKMQAGLCEFLTVRDKRKILIIYSAHSLPVNLVKDDPYVKLMRETIEMAGEMLHFDSKLAFQSKGGGQGVEWLGPSVEEAIDAAVAGNMEAVLLVPISFVADNIETLYDVDIHFKNRAKKAGLKFARAHTLNTYDKFIDVIAEAILPLVD
jgi:ferrochelatase